MSAPDASTGPNSPSFWGRATFGVGLALYGWAMMAVHLYLRFAEVPEGPSKGLALFRRMVIGRAIVALGGAAVLSALILALVARRHPVWRVVAVLLCVAWLAMLIWDWPHLVTKTAS